MVGPRTTGRVVVVSQVPPPWHGSTVMTKFLLDTIESTGRETALVDRRFSREISEVGNFNVRKVFSAAGLVCRFFAAIRRKPDVVILFLTNRKFSFLVDTAIVSVARVRGVKIINYIHTSGFAQMSQSVLSSALAKFALRSAKTNVVLSESLQEDIELFSPSRVTVISNAIETPPRTPRNGRDGPILFISNLIEEKGATEFAAAAALLPDRDFAIYGAPGSSDYMEQLRADIARTPNLTYEGQLQHDHKWTVLARTPLLIFPSRYAFEAQPLTLIEAMSAGVPILATRVGAVPDLIAEAPGCFVLESTNATHMAREAERVLNAGIDKDNLREWALRRYGQDRYQASWDTLIAKVTSED